MFRTLQVTLKQVLLQFASSFLKLQVGGFHFEHQYSDVVAMSLFVAKQEIALLSVVLADVARQTEDRLCSLSEDGVSFGTLSAVLFWMFRDKESF